MSTQVTPEPTPEVDPTPAPPTDPNPSNKVDLNPLYEQAYRDASARAARAEEQLAAAQNRVNPAPVNTPTPTNDEYWNDPATFIRREITNALTDTIKPFQQNLEIDSRQRKYQEAKAIIRNAVPYFNQIESEVDAVMSRGNLDPTPQNIQLALSIVVGNRALQGNPVTMNTSTPVIPINRNQNNNMLPPNVAPSAPPAPVPHPVTQAAPLTEIERRIMREQGFKSEAEYIYYRDMPDQITSVPSYAQTQEK